MGCPIRLAIRIPLLRCIAVTVLMLFSGRSLISQLVTSDISQYDHTSWLSREGYFRGAPTAITQTKDGYIWIGSPFGLFRFDGVTFTPSQPAGGQVLGSLSIHRLLGDRDGSLWIGTDGKGLLHLKDGRITAIPVFSDVLSVGGILQDETGDIWAGGVKRGALNRLCRIHGESVQCFGDTKTFGIWIQRLFQDKRGTLWVGADSGLWRWAPGKPTLVADGSADKGLAIDANDIMVEPERKEHQGLKDSNRDYLASTKIKLAELPGCKFLTDRRGGLWIGTPNSGLVHSFRGRIDTYRAVDGLSNDTIYDLFEDAEGDIWVTTGKGVDRFREQAVPIVSSRQGLSSDIVTSVVAYERNVWIGSVDGLNLVTDASIKNYGVMDGLPTNDVASLYSEPGRLLVSTERPNGLAWIQDGHITKSAAPSGPSTLVIASDGAGGLWLSNREPGLVHLSPTGGTVEVVPWTVFGDKVATAMAFDFKRKGLWLAFVRGDLEFFENGQVKERYLNALQNPRDLQVGSDGTVWVASNAGLTRLRDKQLATLSSRNGLPCDGVQWRKDDDQHSTWLNTPCGVVQLAPGELDRWSHDPSVPVKVTKYLDPFEGAEQSLIGGYYTPRVTTTPDRRLAFITSSGLAVIDPRRDFVNHLPPPVHIEHVEADAKVYSLEQTVALPPKVHVVRLGYSALSFRIPQKVRYRYKLEGYDGDWSQVSSTREAVYTKLPPGKYRFHVIAANDSGVWNTVGDTLDFTVRAAFYQTGWFHLILLGTAGVLIWIAYRYRIRYLYRQVSNRIEVQTNERLNVSRDLHDTLLQGVQGLILSFHALSEDATLEQSVREKIIAIGDRAEETMEEAREKIRALRFEKQLDPSFARHVASLASRMNPEEPPVFSLSVVGQEVALKPLVYEEVCFICREALSNAFRHANAQKVEVAIGFEPSRFSLVIRDDGQGLQPRETLAASLNGHWGIIGMRERAGRIGAKFEIRSAFPEHVPPGTAVVIEVPASIAYKSATS